jgi:hypothetical protein
MIQIPANLAQRILDAARIAAAMHEEGLRQQLIPVTAGGAGDRRPVDQAEGLRCAFGTSDAPR